MRCVRSGSRLPRLTRLILQTGRAELRELLVPFIERVFGHTDQRGEVARRQSAAAPRVEQQQALRAGQRCASRGLWLCQRAVAAARPGRQPQLGQVHLRRPDFLFLVGRVAHLFCVICSIHFFLRRRPSGHRCG